VLIKSLAAKGLSTNDDFLSHILGSEISKVLDAGRGENYTTCVEGTFSLKWWDDSIVREIYFWLYM
jgi:hypothetical protein